MKCAYVISLISHFRPWKHITHIYSCNIGNCFEQKEQSMVSSPSGCDLTTNVYNWTVVLPGVIIVKSYMFIIHKIICVYAIDAVVNQ